MGVVNLLTKTITTAQAGQLSSTFVLQGVGIGDIMLQGKLVYGSGGTTIDAWLQTSLDTGATWCDVANFHYTTASARLLFHLTGSTVIAAAAAATDGTLAANTATDGIIGPLWRVKTTSVGTYAGGTTLTIDALFNGVNKAVAVV